MPRTTLDSPSLDDLLADPEVFANGKPAWAREPGSGWADGPPAPRVVKRREHVPAAPRKLPRARKAQEDQDAQMFLSRSGFEPAALFLNRSALDSWSHLTTNGTRLSFQRAIVKAELLSPEVARVAVGEPPRSDRSYTYWFFHDKNLIAILSEYRCIAVFHAKEGQQKVIKGEISLEEARKDPRLLRGDPPRKPKVKKVQALADEPEIPWFPEELPDDLDGLEELHSRLKDHRAYLIARKNCATNRVDALSGVVKRRIEKAKEILRKQRREEFLAALQEPGEAEAETIIRALMPLARRIPKDQRTDEEQKILLLSRHWLKTRTNGGAV